METLLPASLSNYLLGLAESPIGQLPKIGTVTQPGEVIVRGQKKRLNTGELKKGQRVIVFDAQLHQEFPHY